MAGGTGIERAWLLAPVALMGALIWSVAAHAQSGPAITFGESRRFSPTKPPILVAVPSALQQTGPRPLPGFDVATFRRNKEDEEQRAIARQRDPNIQLPFGRAQARPGGVLQGRGMTVRELVRDAYGYRHRPATEVVGGPAWIDTERYDVLAKANADFSSSTNLGLPRQAESALRTLLSERLKLRVHVDSRRQRVYELLTLRDDGRHGPSMVPSKGGCLSYYAREAQIPGAPVASQDRASPAPVRGCQWNISSGGVLFEGMTMDEWALYLGGLPQLNATVLNRTRLTGVFDIKLEFSGPSTPGLLPNVAAFMEQQLGLRLRPTEGVVQILVIDTVDRPSEN